MLEAREKVPLIDISALFSGNEAGKTSVAKQLVSAASDRGVFCIIGHNISPQLQNEAYAESRAFFELPYAIKQHLSNQNTSNMHGYFGVYEEISETECVADYKEGFELGSELQSVKSKITGHSRNQWPAGNDKFKSVMLKYYKDLLVLSMNLLRVFARGLGKQDNYFENFLSKHSSKLRLLHYPPSPTEPVVIGCGEHTDYGVLTILTQSTRGLQVKTRDGQWIDVDAEPEVLVVNVGDMMSHWTNDKFYSSLHRVINESHDDRYSLIFFLDPSWDALIKCLDFCIEPGTEARYLPIMFDEYRRAKLDATFNTVKSAELLYSDRGHLCRD